MGEHFLVPCASGSALPALYVTMATLSLSAKMFTLQLKDTSLVDSGTESRVVAGVVGAGGEVAAGFDSVGGDH
jgi:hypothetical protein